MGAASQARKKVRPAKTNSMSESKATSRQPCAPAWNIGEFAEIGIMRAALARSTGNFETGKTTSSSASISFARRCQRAVGKSRVSGAAGGFVR